MTDLIERLRGLTFIDETGEAADEIERLHISCKHFEKDIKRLKEINYELQFGLGLRDEQIAKLQAVVDAAKRSRETDEYGLLSVEKGWELDRALAALEEE